MRAGARGGEEDAVERRRARGTVQNMNEAAASFIFFLENYGGWM
jgi:hypothetical protein